MGETTIEWTDVTWNPTRGCSRVSPGCGGGTPGGGGGCYAEAIAARFSGPGMAYEGLAEMTKDGPRWTGRMRLVKEKLEEPLSWRKPRRVFVNSMSDLFHEGLAAEEIAQVFAVMAQAPQHTFQVLTKRSERMRELFTASSRTGGSGDFRCLVADTLTLSDEKSLDWPLPNVWLGVSVENQKYADERIPHLLATPAAVRFLSCEPLLGPVDLELDEISIAFAQLEPNENILGPIDWVIVGGESGHGARPLDLAWARSLVEQCRAASVPCFVKQLGAVPTVGYYDDEARNWFEANGWEWPAPIGWSECDGQPGLDARVNVRGRDRKGGDPSEWPADLRVREFPVVRP